MKFVALWLGLICGFIFLLQLSVGTDLFILQRGIVLFEPWRIITALFAHANLAHLLSNLFALGLFGLILEGRIGPYRVLWLFLGSGILINLFPLYERSLGASGAIYALIGALAILRPWMVVWVSYMPMPMVFAGVMYAISDVIGVFVPSNIGNFAHLSGLGIGIIAGLIWRKKFADPPRKQSIKRNQTIERALDVWEDTYMKK